MAYIGIVPALTITSQDAGDIMWQQHVIVDNTTIELNFSLEDAPREIVLELNNAGSFTITYSVVDSNQTLLWAGGTEPTLTTGKDILRFFYDGSGQIFGTVLGLNFS